MSRTDDPHPLIRRFRAMGMSDGVIFNRLLLEGWAEDDIKHAFENRSEISQAAMVEEASPSLHHETWSEVEGEIVEKVSRKRFSFATLAFAALIACGIGAGAYLYLKPPATYSISIPSASAAVALELSYGALPAISDPDYYLGIKKKLVEQGGAFIDANLSSMQLAVYRDGVLQLQVPILAKGKPGSWWETPAGIYKIETKEKMHFSSFGQVQMPYSLDFQGNFFIHGWPTYPDGTPVSSTFSGGCIRLSTKDAEKVFLLARVGEPVIVYNEEPEKIPFNYTLRAPSVISASEYLIADLDTGAILAARAASSSASIASITKLITALVATEYINLDKYITVPEDALVYTSVPRLKQGSTVRAYDLLFLLLQESSNEAAETLAASVGRDAFLANMNKKAAAIGLAHTSFSDPSGAKNDISTPADLFKLLRYIYDNRRFVFDITTGAITDSAYGKPAFGVINNFNIVRNAPADFLGGKIGQTNEAGETYAGIFSMKMGDTLTPGRAGGQAERKLAIIVLGSKDAQADVLRLLNFVHTSYAPAQ